MVHVLFEFGCAIALFLAVEVLTGNHENDEECDANDDF